jgi:CRP-like cAMP-binding protein
MLLTVERVLFLKKVEMFTDIDDDALAHLATTMSEQDSPAGTAIIREGDDGRELFILVTGSARIHKGERTLATIGPKGVVGELAALDPQPRTASVTALEDCHLLSLGHAVLFEELMSNNDLARGIIRFLVRRFRERA